MITIHIPIRYQGHSNHEIMIDRRLFNTWDMCCAREQNIYKKVIFFQNNLSNESNEMQMIFSYNLYFKKFLKKNSKLLWKKRRIISFRYLYTLYCNHCTRCCWSKWINFDAKIRIFWKNGSENYNICMNEHGSSQRCRWQPANSSLNFLQMNRNENI